MGVRISLVFWACNRTSKSSGCSTITRTIWDRRKKPTNYFYLRNQLVYFSFHLSNMQKFLLCFILTLFSSMVRSFFHPVLVRSKIRLAESDADKVVEMILNETIPLEWRKTLLSSLVKDKERAERDGASRQS